MANLEYESSGIDITNSIKLATNNGYYNIIGYQAL